MAQAGNTPIQLYYSTTAAAVPTSGNLVSGELAINIVDGKLYYKDNGGSVQTLAVSPSMPQVISVNSSSDALRITQTGAGNALVVEDSANPDATPFVVDASGAVIIGSTTGVTGVANTFQVIGDGVAANIGQSRFTDDANPPNFGQRKARGTKSSPTIVQSGDNLAQYIAQGYDGASYIQAASITASVDGTPGTNDMPGRLVFSTTADGASTSTERMRIDSAGQVGIGGATVAGQNLRLVKAITGATTAMGTRAINTIQSDVTSSAYIFDSVPTTEATAFTLATLAHYRASPTAFGAGSAVTTQVGFLAESTLTGATDNYGFYSNIASGTGRWNFHAAGTAANYFGGQVQLNQDYIEKRFTANSSTAITLDLANGTMQDITLTGTATITMPTAVAGKSFILLLRSGAGSYGVTWTTVKWPGGTAPTVTTTASRLDIYSFFSDGTNWYGITVSQNYTP
jgi:hypothetical protein